MDLFLLFTPLDTFSCSLNLLESLVEQLTVYFFFIFLPPSLPELCHDAQ